MIAWWTDPIPLPRLVFLLLVMAAYSAGCWVMWRHGARDRKILAALREAKDEGEIQDVKEQADEQ